jgi:hypothetical protein
MGNRSRGSRLNPFCKEEQPKIEFISRIPHLRDIEEVQPKPASKFLPEWWKDMPYSLDLDKNKHRPETLMARRCPSFPDYFSSGYIIPMWADTVLYYSAKTTEWKWQCGNATGSPFQINFFEPHRFQDYGSTFLHGQRASAIWQFVNPWTVTTSPGYYLLQLPLFFHQQTEFSAFPGMYDAHAADTDKLEIATYKTDEEIFIKRGTPLVQLIPIKRHNFEIITRDEEHADREKQDKRALLKATTFGIKYNQLKTKK